MRSASPSVRRGSVLVMAAPLGPSSMEPKEVGSRTGVYRPAPYVLPGALLKGRGTLSNWDRGAIE
ncbi:MAG: hypothetical protein LZF60_420047 [Nitrospira sp.]|nr:MAG: hypothetical protein LZF60_420047 [Nitrospira sp.]